MPLVVTSFKQVAVDWIGSRENEGTERDTEGVGQDMSIHNDNMSIPLKLFLV